MYKGRKLDNTVINNIRADTIAIANYAFSGLADLSAITIPASVMFIGGGAFSYCTSLTNITIPSSIKVIGEYAFSNCTSLTSIQVDDKNSNYASQDGILYNKTKTTLVLAPKGIIGTVTIPTSVMFIDDGAFSDWTVSQTINIQGHASEAAADAAWGGSYWRNDCNATINYLGN